MKTFAIYRHTAPSGKIYVGQTCKKPIYRWANGHHYTHNPYFNNAIQKHGWDNIKHEILFDGLTQEEANDLEIKLIGHYQKLGICYNIAVGGQDGCMLGRRHTIETRKKMSEAHKGIRPSEESKLKNSLAHKGRPSPNKGKPVPDEIRKKISETLSGKNHPNFGKHLSVETRKKISEAHKGKHLSVETRKKISEAHKGKTNGAVGLKWIHKGNTKKRVSPTELTQYIDNGWLLGLGPR